MVSIFVAACLGICLSAACGLRVFLPFLVVGIAARCEMLELRDGYMWIGTWPAIMAFSTATILEVGCYYVPALDNLLDTIATPAAGIAGALMTVAVMPDDMSPLYSWCIGIIGGGGVATGVQLVTVGTRTLSTASTGGVGNHVVATGEAVGSAGIAISALFIPVIVGVIVMSAICIMVYLIFEKGGKLFSGRKAAVS